MQEWNREKQIGWNENGGKWIQTEVCEGVEEGSERRKSTTLGMIEIKTELHRVSESERKRKNGT